MYLVGPALVGVAAVPAPLEWLQQPMHVLLLLAWTLPANMVLYGCNDLADEDTDALNAKKQGYEQRMERSKRKSTWIMVTVSAVVLVVVATLTQNSTVIGWTCGFFALAVGYSVPPFRFKAKPFVDSLSNVLYIFPGFAIAATADVPLALSVFIGGWCWSAAMHLFSAIPDIVPDREAKLSTTAVVLGKTGALCTCSVLWLVATLCAVATPAVGVVGWLGIVYVAVPLLLLRSSDTALFGAYARMPLLNTLLGGVIFWAVLL